MLRPRLKNVDCAVVDRKRQNQLLQDLIGFKDRLRDRVLVLEHRLAVADTHCPQDLCVSLVSAQLN